MLTRRTFFKKSGLAASALALERARLQGAADRASGLPPATLAGDEAYWR
jgi:hypothetical protein